jgi:hypothetical protein
MWSLKLRIILFFYFFVLYIGVINPSIPMDFGFIFSSILILLIILLYISKRSIRDLYFVFCSFLIILLHTHSNIIYMFLDIIVFGIVIHLLNMAAKKNIMSKDISLIKILYIVYIAVNLLISLIPSYYSFPSSYSSEQRFHGFMGSNLSSTIIALFIITLWEIYKLGKSNRLSYLMFLAGIYLYFFFISKSRTMIFALPYFLYQFTNIKKKNIFLSLFLLLFVIGFVYTNLEYFRTKLRFDPSEISYLSRANMYFMFLNRIKENNFIIPYGFNASTTYIRLRNGANWSVHNSILQYWYDYGIIFWIIMILIVSKLKRFINMNLLLILLFVLSSALHNLLFVYVIWVPLFFILLITRKKRVFL